MLENLKLTFKINLVVICTGWREKAQIWLSSFEDI